MSPEYYTSLRPFRDLFGRGNPILTYHKVGPRPRRTRIRGLYVRPELFARQMRELHAGGFANGALADCAGPRTTPRIVVTFDDGYVNVLEHALEPLARAGYRAVQFLVADRLGQCNTWDVPMGEAPEPIMSEGQVREWLAAGHEIGAHTLTHPHLTRLPAGPAREEIVGSKQRLEDRFGRAIEHFCYPYGDWNPAVRDLVAEAGFLTACTTEFGVNAVADDRLALKRVTARYASRNWKTVRSWLRQWFDR